MSDWENEDFDPTVPAVKPAPTDKWDGEDEDDDVKDSWEDEDEEKEKEGEGQPKAYQKPKKKPLAERIAEKNRAKEEAEKAAKAEKRELTAAEKLAEKIRLQKIQEEADLKNAKDLFGVGEGLPPKGIDAMLPETKEEFDAFADALKAKITFFESSELYGAFVEKLINDVSVSLPAEVIKKVGISLNQLYHEKDRLRKEAAKNKKKKQKATIKYDKADDLGLADGSGATYFDDDDDFI